MTAAQKVRSVARNLEILIEELPIFLLRLEEVTAALDEKLEWREFKFCFKVGTSKVSGILQKLLSHRSTLHDVIAQVCELVQRDAFTQSMYVLGLLDPTTQGNNVDCQRTSKTVVNTTPKQHSYKVSTISPSHLGVFYLMSGGMKLHPFGRIRNKFYLGGFFQSNICFLVKFSRIALHFTLGKQFNVIEVISTIIKKWIGYGYGIRSNMFAWIKRSRQQSRIRRKMYN